MPAGLLFFPEINFFIDPCYKGVYDSFVARSSTSYKSKWKSGQTTVVRVPKVFVPEVKEYARFLDSVHSGESASPTQFYLPTLEKIDKSKPINISKIVHRSPFRYPGGKTWFIPYLRKWLLAKEPKPSLFIEPFAGGAIRSLTVAFEHWSKHVLFSEIDERIASVWHTILTGQHSWLAEKIVDYDLTIDNVREDLFREEKADLSLEEKAFCTILRNRVQRGGILTKGAGLIKNGENGKGIGSRWYPSTLAKRIREIGTIAHRLSFEKTDGFNLIERFKNEPDYVFFIDPPYTKAAKRLYDHWEFDHDRLFNEISRVKGDFLMTYDNTEEIKKLSAKYKLQYAEIAMKNTHHNRMTELVIGRNLSWLDSES